MSGDQCRECLVGRCRPVLLPYLRQFGPHMIVLPNGPASRCDMCGHVDFQPEFLMTMQLMLEEIAKEQRSTGNRPKPLAEHRQEWTPAGHEG